MARICRAVHFGIGDHRVAARHHRIVPALQPPVRVVDAVIGGDEGDLGPPGRDQRAPGRCPGAGVHEHDILLADEIGDGVGIAKYRVRHFRSHRHRDQFAARFNELALQPPALADDERAKAFLDQRFCDVDGGALGAPGIERGHDLKDCGHTIWLAVGHALNLRHPCRGNERSRRMGLEKLLREDGKTIAYLRIHGKQAPNALANLRFSRPLRPQVPTAGSDRNAKEAPELCEQERR